VGCGFSQGDHLAVGGGILCGKHLIESLANDFSISDNHAAKWPSMTAGAAQAGQLDRT
jgi:uncharacterized Ntn-hydrolase superfamily protein